MCFIRSTISAVIEVKAFELTKVVEHNTYIVTPGLALYLSFIKNEKKKLQKTWVAFVTLYEHQDGTDYKNYSYELSYTCTFNNIFSPTKYLL